MPNSNPLPHYRSYLLRFWEDSAETRALPDAATVWRFSLEDPRTGERRGFADLQRLLDYLKEQMQVARQDHDDSLPANHANLR